MAEIIEFLSSHWMLSGGFVIVLVLFLANEMKQKVSGAMRVSPAEAVSLMNHSDTVVIDVRHLDAFKEGHIVDSQNIPFSELDNKKATVNRLKKKQILVVCEQGLQSPKAVKQLQADGFEQVSFIAGGILSWKAENLPLTKKN